MKHILSIFLLSILFGCNTPPIPEKNPEEYFCLDSPFDLNTIDDLTVVTKVSCDIDDFTDLSVLAKLTNLKKLNLSGSYASEARVIFDTSWISNLESLYLHDLLIDDIDFANLKNLKEISLIKVDINSSFNNIGQASGLQRLFLNEVNIESLDLYDNTELSFIMMRKTNVRHFDFSNNAKLEELKLSENSNASSELDLVSQPLLHSIDISNQGLNELNVYLPNLKQALITFTNLAKIDFINSPNLQVLILQSNLIEEINFDSYTNLNTLNLENNPLTIATKEYLESLVWIKNVSY
jgi:Leucine-rich repeat (LRR) protein